MCAAFDVDGMRADIVTARTALAHAAWHGRDRVTIDDVRVAARLALPHRRRRDPFDTPGLDEERLDEALQRAQDAHPDDPDDAGPDDRGPDGGGPQRRRPGRRRRPERGRTDGGGPQGGDRGGDGATRCARAGALAARTALARRAHDGPDGADGWPQRQPDDAAADARARRRRDRGRWPATGDRCDDPTAAGVSRWPYPGVG